MKPGLQIDVIIKAPCDHKPGEPWPFPNVGTMLLGESAEKFAAFILSVMERISPEQAASVRGTPVDQVGIVIRAYVVGGSL